ncbi:MAG: ABC transporter permease, partial [Firmicutes bacterium]|nr:ABC transporter permease [Bacillota bacterium]
ELIRPQDRVVRLADGQVVSDTLRTDQTRPDGAFSGTASITPARTVPGWSFWMARRNILRAKARTMLTALGTAIGIGSIVLTIAFGKGLQHNAQTSLNQNGNINMVQVLGKLPPDASLDAVYRPAALTPQTVRRFSRIAGIKQAFGVINRRGTIMTPQKSMVPLELTTFPPHHLLSNQRLVAGTLQHQPQAIYLNTTLARHLFPHQTYAQMVGRNLIMGLTRHHPLHEVIAGIVFIKKGDQEWTQLNPNSAYIAYVPYNALHRDFGRPLRFSEALIETRTAAQTLHITHELLQHGYLVFSLEQIAQGIRTFVLMVQGVLIAFGGISLVVAGIMISLVMMWSVIERTREIGVLKSLGARNRDIRRIFIVEAGMIGFLAGIFGLIVGEIAGEGIQSFLQKTIHQEGGLVPHHLFMLPLWVIAGSLGFGVVIGVVGAWIPAYKASRLVIIQALRPR